MTTPAHTPLPWRVDLEKMSNGLIERSRAISISNEQWDIAAVWRDLETEGEAEANARYIVTACNAYPKLVEALEMAKRHLADSCDPTARLIPTNAKIDAALREAGAIN